MPQATEELRDAMNRYFGDPIDETGPMQYLKSVGYTLGKNWSWTRPSPDHKPTEKELECIDFLFQEWDMGGFL